MYLGCIESTSVGSRGLRFFFFKTLSPQSSVDIEIPVSNPGKEALKLNVYLEGDDLSGQSWVLISPEDTFIYRATYSPVSMGKGTGR